MDLSLVEKVLTFLKIPFQSFLTIEIFLIFIILYIFLVYNEKRKNKKVKIFLTALIIFFIFLLIFYFQEDISIVFSEIIKTLMRCFYFPNIIFYFLTVIITLIVLIYTIFKPNITRLNKIITYAITLADLFLFTNFISLAISNNTSLTNTANIYQHDEMFILVLVSQIIFLILIIYKSIYHFCYIKLRQSHKNLT